MKRTLLIILNNKIKIKLSNKMFKIKIVDRLFVFQKIVILCFHKIIKYVILKQ